MLSSCGRPKESLVWQYFKYDAITDHSMCLVETSNLNTNEADSGTSGITAVKCNARIKGKNSTNLITHFKKQGMDQSVIVRTSL